MKNIIISFLTWCALLMTALTYAQDRYSIQLTTDNVIFQKGIAYAGIEFDCEFNNHIYIRPQLHFADLKDGYLETAAAMGYHFKQNRWTSKAGIKLGLIHRASYDRRSDADFYDGKDWVYNSQGFIKFTL